MTIARVVLVGASGRMGKEIEDVINANDNFEIAFRVGKNLPKDPRNVEDLNQLKIEIENLIVIDFSTATFFKEVLQWCKDAGVPLVSGTTGLNDSDFELIKLASQSVPVLWSSNMSLGINLLRRLIHQLGPIKDFDFQVEDFHHNKKIDSPSGTAVTLQQDLKKAVQKDLPEVVSVRAGGIFGIHKINAVSNEEMIVLEHRALNRTVFAKGAVTAAAWLLQKKPGHYSMLDVLEV